MPFPSNVLRDNFNRADESPLSGGGKWAAGPKYSTSLRLVANRAGPPTTSNDAASHWTDAFHAQQEAWTTIAAILTTTALVKICARIQPQTGTPDDCYYAEANAGSGQANNIEVGRYDNGVSTILGATVATTWAAGDAIGIECSGSTVTAFRKPAGGAWATMASRTDTTYPAGGFIGMVCFPQETRVDDFGGGSILTAVGRDLAAAATVRARAARDLIVLATLRGLAGRALALPVTISAFRQVVARLGSVARVTLRAGARALTVRGGRGDVRLRGGSRGVR